MYNHSIGITKFLLELKFHKRCAQKWFLKMDIYLKTAQVKKELLPVNTNY